MRSREKKHYSLFEQIKKTDENGAEYWSARDMRKALEYSEYQHFIYVIDKAKKSCKNSGQSTTDHFEDILDMVEIGSGAKRQLKSVKLSRYACYLIVQNHGYIGLYGGLDAKDIHAQKKLKKSQKILDHMGSTELAANLFRATQTEDKLNREKIKGKAKANKAHHDVGTKVRQTIKELGGTMPENLPIADSIKTLESKQKKQLEKKKSKTT